MLLSLAVVFCFFVLTIDCVVNGLSSIRNDRIPRKSLSKSRSRRALYAPNQTGMALALALAVPVDNGMGNVFVSLCIETNYNQYTYSDGGVLDPPLFTTIGGDGGSRKLSDDLIAPIEGNTTFTKKGKTSKAETTAKNSERKTKKPDRKETKVKQLRKKMRKNSFITRRRVYRSIENKLQEHGFNGRACILKAICEANSYNFGLNNGLVGDVVHIIFTPSTSKDENLSIKYYEAELKGAKGECFSYVNSCPMGIFELISLIE